MKRVIVILLWLNILVGSVIATEQTVTMQDTTITYTEAQRDSLWQQPDFVRAYLAVAEPGGALYSIFGHACLHLVCPAYGLDYYFTYESENASKRVLKFLSGNLKMGMMNLTPDEYLSDYKTEGRGVVEYELNLPIDIKRELWRILDNHVMEGIYLPYDFEARGCAYASLHMIRMAMNGATIEWGEWPEKYDKTRRELAHDFAQDIYPWNLMFIMAMVGTEIDRELPPPQKLIVPTDLLESLQKAKVNGEQLLSCEPHVLVESTNQHKAPWCRPWMVATLLLVLAIANLWGKCKYIDWLILGLVTMIGIVITYLVAFSTLPCTEWNWLIIPFNILPAIAWRWRKYWAWPYAGIIFIWMCGMIVPQHQLADTALLILAGAWMVTLIRQRDLKIEK